MTKSPQVLRINRAQDRVAQPRTHEDIVESLLQLIQPRIAWAVRETMPTDDFAPRKWQGIGIALNLYQWVNGEPGTVCVKVLPCPVKEHYASMESMEIEVKKRWRTGISRQNGSLDIPYEDKVSESIASIVDLCKAKFYPSAVQALYALRANTDPLVTVTIEVRQGYFFSDQLLQESQSPAWADMVRTR